MNFDFFPAKIARNRPIVPRILTFLPRKSREIDRFSREFAPENPAKFCFFFREISEALAKGILLLLSNYPLKYVVAQENENHQSHNEKYDQYPNDDDRPAFTIGAS